MQKGNGGAARCSCFHVTCYIARSIGRTESLDNIGCIMFVNVITGFMEVMIYIEFWFKSLCIFSVRQLLFSVACFERFWMVFCGTICVRVVCGCVHRSASKM